MEDLVESVSGIRGIFGKSITEEFASKYAAAYSLWLTKILRRKPKIVIGMDTRKSGPKLKQSMIDTSSNFCDCIIDVNIATTPMIELAVREYKADGGIIITASHNEPKFNGWKLLDKDGSVIKEEKLKQIQELLKNAKKNENPTKKKKTTKNLVCKIENKNLDLQDKYRGFIIKLIGKDKLEKIKKANLKIIVDHNGGAAWEIVGKVLNDFGVKSNLIVTSPGDFRRQIEPNEESLFYMAKIVEEENASFGVGFDCDADRAEFVLPFGKIYGTVLSGHYQIAIIADNILPKTQKDKRIVVVNDATSKVVEDVVKSYNGKLYYTEVGEANVVFGMKKYKAILGGEGSSAGAIIPPSKCRDGILTTIYFLDISPTCFLTSAINSRLARARSASVSPLCISVKFSIGNLESIQRSPASVLSTASTFIPDLKEYWK